MGKDMLQVRCVVRSFYRDSLMVGDLQGLLTVVEAPGYPLRPDIRLSRSAKRSNNAN
jgi:hypothetical protein